ncbi:hypothetical protein TWF718_004028 [Orbilia javanica]|uniref:non-reducing end alpha-L-arabinofuranosidase n=1 Tax=Orbilia javanica TaxID=47235 RepID=A0AAN8RF81_9PEZI
MTTFTKTSSKTEASILVDSRRALYDIDPLIYSGFTEHMGRCIYGGIYDPGNPLSDSKGFRMDVMDALRDLKVPCFRYPGGNFVCTYSWLDGVGPRESRPKRPELAWKGVESNQFGTDDFMEWCEELGAEPYICLNMATGTLMEALGWLEYCNSDQDTYYANLRRKNGRDKPYKVKYWALGNEMWGPWQVGQMTKEDYAKKAHQWGKALKLLDPSIKLILCGENGTSDWDRYVLQNCIEYIDMHSIHIYTADAEHVPNVIAPLSAERAIEVTASLIDLARINNRFTNPPTADTHIIHKPTICFDEWNVWMYTRAPGDQGAEESYTLSDALAVGVWLNVFVRQARYLGMANIAQSVNVISPLMTTKGGIVKQTSYFILYLFSNYMRGKTLGIHLSSGVYEGRTVPEWISTTMDAPWLDVSGAISEDGFINLSVVNISEDDDITTQVSIPEGTQVRVFRVGGSRFKVTDTNMAGEEVINIQEDTWMARSTFSFEKRSYTLLRWKPT